MKKTISLLVVLVLGLGTFISCSSSGENTTVNKNTTTNNQSGNSSKSEQDKEEGFAFSANGVEIVMHKDAKDILAALGKEKTYFESQSCAFPGLDKVYTYNSFEVSTYPTDDKDYIAGVSFLDDTVSTKEGVCLYQTVEDMKKAYGDDYKEHNGIYVYTKGKTQLSFMVKDNEIVQIEYIATQE